MRQQSCPFKRSKPSSSPCLSFLIAFAWRRVSSTACSTEARLERFGMAASFVIDTVVVTAKPWDDDIDVAIKREDCERLFSAIEQNTNDRYRVLRPFNPPDYRHPYAKMVDCRTSLVEPKNLPVRDMGVFIDFFPVDAFARSGWPTRARLKLANFANKAYCSAYVRDGSAPLGKVSKFAGLVTRIMFHGVGPQRCHELVEKLVQLGSRSDGDFLACPYDADYIIPRNWVFPCRLEAFESRSFPVPGNSDSYLKAMYGNDYMTPTRQADSFHGVAWLRESGGDS